MVAMMVPSATPMLLGLDADPCRSRCNEYSGNGSANHCHFCRKTFASRPSHSAAHQYFFLRCSSRGGDFSQPLSRSEAVLYSSTVNRNSRETEIHPTQKTVRSGCIQRNFLVTGGCDRAWTAYFDLAPLQREDHLVRRPGNAD